MDAVDWHARCSHCCKGSVDTCFPTSQSDTPSDSAEKYLHCAEARVRTSGHRRVRKHTLPSKDSLHFEYAMVSDSSSRRRYLLRQTACSTRLRVMHSAATRTCYRFTDTLYGKKYLAHHRPAQSRQYTAISTNSTEECLRSTQARHSHHPRSYTTGKVSE